MANYPKTAAGFLAAARAQIGKPYAFGAAGPGSFDCSGLVFYSCHLCGIADIPRTSEAQFAWCNRVDESGLQPGMLVFEQWPGDAQAAPGHVVIYSGSNKVIEAPHSGANVRERKWSPAETTIPGYGAIPGLGQWQPSADAQAAAASSTPPDPVAQGIISFLLGPR